MNTMKFKIEEELIKIGFNPLHKGTIYLIETINIIYNSNNQKSMYKINLEKDVYSKLSIKLSKNIRTIKSDISKATNLVDINNFNNNNKRIENNNLKLTPKLVIWKVITEINKKK